MLIDREINSVAQDTIYDPELLKVKFLKGGKKFQKKMDDEVKFGSVSSYINLILENLNDHSSLHEVKKVIRNVDQKKFKSYGRGYYMGMNIVKYLIRDSIRKTHKFYQRLKYCNMIWRIFIFFYFVLFKTFAAGFNPSIIF